jgi:hypothetical protein
MTKKIAPIQAFEALEQKCIGEVFDLNSFMKFGYKLCVWFLDVL